MFELSDVKIKSVGLVRRGAVSSDDNDEGVNFLILKSEDSMPDDTVSVEEVLEEAPPTTDSPNFWDSLKKKMTEWGVVPAEEPPKVEEQVTEKQGGGYGGAKPDNAMEDDEEDKEEDDEEDKMKKSEETVLESPVIKAFLDKQQELHQQQLEAAQTVIKAEYEGQIKELTEKVESLSKKADASEAEVERREMIAKAQQYRMFPIPTTELADMLIRLRKADPEGFEKWEEIIKAADNQLGASALFGEVGTTRTPEEVEAFEAAMAKAKAENISIKEAMLSMPAYKQQELLDKSRNRARGGK